MKTKLVLASAICIALTGCNSYVKTLVDNLDTSKSDDKPVVESAPVKVSSPSVGSAPIETRSPSIVADKPFLFLPTVPASTGSRVCSTAVQGKIAWNYKGTTAWQPANVARLCAGAESSKQPAVCFNEVMHHNVSWGSGTKWLWQNALDLCQGTTNASQTIQCFKEDISSNSGWRKAISDCKQPGRST